MVDYIIGLEFDVLVVADVLDAGRAYHEHFSFIVLAGKNEVDLLFDVSWLLECVLL